MMAGVLAGVLVFVVALPLALSSPYPTPRQGDWIIQTAVGQMTLASAEPPVPVPGPVDTQPAFEETAFSARWTLASAAPSDTADVPTGTVRLAMADESTPFTVAPPLVEIPLPAEATQIKPAERKSAVAPAPKTQDLKAQDLKTQEAKTAAVNPMDEVDQYLWEVYQRAPIKKDSSGDFTWKDPAAAKKRGISLKDYVIAGMEPDFREQLYHAGRAMDARGIHWSMLSAFRDDYRQALASGFKAHGGNSLHGGSNATGGYGHGRALDIKNADGDDESVWRWIDQNGAKYGLRRPMPGYDPAHIQAGGNWHNIAQALRQGRTQVAAGVKPKNAKTAM